MNENLFLLTAIPCKTGPIMENPKTNFFDHLYGNQ